MILIIFFHGMLSICMSGSALEHKHPTNDIEVTLKQKNHWGRDVASKNTDNLSVYFSRRNILPEKSNISLF